MLKRWMKSNKGFTLVELMVVIIILGILVAIAVPIYNDVTYNAKVRACEANIRTLNGAISMYYSKEGKYPDDISELDPYVKDASTLKCPVNGSDYYQLNNARDAIEPHNHKNNSDTSGDNSN